MNKFIIVLLTAFCFACGDGNSLPLLEDGIYSVDLIQEDTDFLSSEGYKAKWEITSAYNEKRECFIYSIAGEETHYIGLQEGKKSLVFSEVTNYLVNRCGDWNAFYIKIEPKDMDKFVGFFVGLYFNCSDNQIPGIPAFDSTTRQPKDYNPTEVNQMFDKFILRGNKEK